MKQFTNQLLPIFLTVLTFFVLVIFLHGFISLLNLFPTRGKIELILLPADILIGLTIYLKTSIDFALFLGKLMSRFPGWKKSIAIEVGTSLGNGIGTLLILTIWTFFKEIPLLLFGMIVLASLVLFRLAEESLKFKPLLFFNKLFSPITSFLIPKAVMQKNSALGFMGLLFFSITIPFVLGLDDFAGYIPLFTIVNVFGFSVGVLLGHMLLTTALFANPQKTIAIIRLHAVEVFGSIVFIGLGLWGLVEAAQILFRIIQ